ncbi:phage tail family protein [Pseudalkalibacillus sp. JSM 102089]|uniref:phage tail family protein n=1 Tax=Pseudalkalibacillus sp. JSM 102089 TaxID=3229856 RepID=UPI003525BBE6
MNRYLTIQRLNGQEYILNKQNGFIVSSFKISAPSPRIASEYVEGLDGYIDMGADYAERRIESTLHFLALDEIDYILKRNEIFSIFASKEQFYVIDSREPGKRWLVRAEGYSPDLVGSRTGTVNINFISASTYAESTGTSLDPKTFALGIWQIGQGLILDETLYTHTTNTFRIYNPSAVDIDPRNLPLVITFRGASTNLQIKNLTTLDFYKYTGSTGTNDKLELSGIRSLKNGVSVFKNTNRKLIKLKSGWNDFEIIGSSSFSITFDFRFYYL